MSQPVASGSNEGTVSVVVHLEAFNENNSIAGPCARCNRSETSGEAAGEGEEEEAPWDEDTVEDWETSEEPGE